MRIEEIGGEFSLINQLAGLVHRDHDKLLTGIGDDAAVIRQDRDDNRFLLVTADTLVEGNHFKTNWSSAKQIGVKAVECNVSDIAAMGGAPSFMFVSLVVPDDTEVEWISSLYNGIAEACARHGVIVAGGDTTKGGTIIIGITLLGNVGKRQLCLRSQGKPGDILVLSGNLGASAAGYHLLNGNLEISPYLQKKHLTPQCRLDIVPEISILANAMIDISDGLAAEVNHICEQSGTGALVFENKIPLHPETISAAKILGMSPERFALTGGEDLELLYSISENRLDALAKSGVDYHIIGRLTERNKGIMLESGDGHFRPLKGGYNHFTS